MRKLIFGINLTLDGCCDHTKMMPDEEIHDYFTDLLRDAGTLVYGRITYQLMVPFWPDVAKNHSGQFESEEAITMYRKSLALNPDNPAGAKHLKKLLKKKN